MRGLTEVEREMLESCLGDFDVEAEIAPFEEQVLCEALARRGLLTTEWTETPEWIVGAWSTTPLGSLALRCDAAARDVLLPA